METWVILLVLFLVGFVVFLLSQPRYVPVAWYNVIPTVYDRLPIMMRYGGTHWVGRGIHRGGHDLGSGAFRGMMPPH